MSKKLKTGRPTLYSLSLVEEICRIVSSSSKGLNHLCAERDHWPCPDTIYHWRHEHKEFSDMYARAKQNQIDVLAEEVLEIADDNSSDNIVGKNGEISSNHANIHRARLRIDTRKWLAAKLMPKIYGDKICQEHAGEDEAPSNFENLSDEELENSVVEIFERAKARKDAEINANSWDTLGTIEDEK